MEKNKCDRSPNGRHMYSKAMEQEYPRKCVHCGEPETISHMEIERRFLLKGLPRVVRESTNWTPYHPTQPVEIWSEEVVPMPKDGSINDIVIEQYYTEDRRTWCNSVLRYRSVRYMRPDSAGLPALNIAYFITQKKRISPGVYEEEEMQISPVEFYRVVLNSNFPKIVKRRFILPTPDGLKWEIDMFVEKHHIIIAEVEMPSTLHLLDIPEFIKEVMLMEVTDKDQFLNSRLAGVYVYNG